MAQPLQQLHLNLGRWLQQLQQPLHQGRLPKGKAPGRCQLPRSFSGGCRWGPDAWHSRCIHDQECLLDSS